MPLEGCVHEIFQVNHWQVEFAGISHKVSNLPLRSSGLLWTGAHAGDPMELPGENSGYTHDTSRLGHDH